MIEILRFAAKKLKYSLKIIAEIKWKFVDNVMLNHPQI